MATLPEQTRTIQLGSQERTYYLKRSYRRRSIEIQIRENGQIFVRAPQFVAQREVEHFLIDRTDWIQEHSKRQENRFNLHQEKSYRHGQEFMFLGKKFPLHVERFSKKRAQIEFLQDRWVILLAQDLDKDKAKETIKKKMWQWYEAQAREIFAARLFEHARIMGEEPNEILVRKQKSIWGSCDKARKIISLNWQLVMAPLWVIDYVIIHELAHLKHANHSARFWARVEKFFPDYKRAKQWFKDNMMDMALPLEG